MMVTVIGRGHSGTRAMSHTLSASGVYMGAQLNGSGDLIPAQDMYEACRIVARRVQHRGGLEWDFSALLAAEPDPEFVRLVSRYLWSVLSNPAPNRGWKLPETILALPWMVRLFPDIHYIYWVRDPWDCILGQHLTDDLRDFGVAYDLTDDVRLRRAISWRYQTATYRATPRPKNLIEVRFEDFILRQEETLIRLEAFLGIPLARIEVRPDSVGRWKTASGEFRFDFLDDERRRYGYEAEPEPAMCR
jgi:hypothetical protein